ncbi:recombinase family protein [Gorillibacterium sp. sgz5001074]|uniref:recombinase family protein n=1 Tax=Gorillibacterium sp. sgz5001074 TaxID=3446695 RepID=UPI003F67E479
MAVSASYLKSLGIESILNYLRKSRQDEERERRTGDDVLTEQKQIMDRVLDPLGIPYDQRTEVGSGDKISTRPVFQTVIEDLRSKKYDAIAVKEISRMGRGSYTDMGIIYDLLRENRIYIITPYKVYDPNNPSDARQIRFELFLSREEFETTRERLTGGRYNSAMAGKWVAGRAPFGYTYNKNTGKLVIDEEEAAVVRTIFDLYVNGVPREDGTRRDVSFRALATYIKRHTPLRTARGYEEWRPIQLRSLLTNDRYIGTIRFRTHETVGGKRVERPAEEHIVVENSHEPIIDIETWEKAQEKDRESRGKPRTKLEFDPCELAGLCYCIACGRKMVRQFSIQKYTTKAGEISTYEKEFLWCTTAGCTFVKYRSIEEDLLAALTYFVELDDDDLFQDQFSKILAEQERNTKRMTAADLAQHVDQRRRELKNRMKFIFEKYESEIYTDEMFLERKREIDQELAQLEAMKIDEPEMANPVIDPAEIRKNLSAVLSTYKSATHKSDRNKILRMVFHRVGVEVLEKGRGRNPAKHMIYPELKYNLLTPSIFGTMND